MKLQSDDAIAWSVVSRIFSGAGSIAVSGKNYYIEKFRKPGAKVPGFSVSFAPIDTFMENFAHVNFTVRQGFQEWL